MMHLGTDQDMLIEDRVKRIYASRTALIDDINNGKTAKELRPQSDAIAEALFDVLVPNAQDFINYENDQLENIVGSDTKKPKQFFRNSQVFWGHEYSPGDEKLKAIVSERTWRHKSPPSSAKKAKTGYAVIRHYDINGWTEIIESPKTESPDLVDIIKKKDNENVRATLEDELKKSDYDYGDSQEFMSWAKKEENIKDLTRWYAWLTKDTKGKAGKKVKHERVVNIKNRSEYTAAKKEVEDYLTKNKDNLRNVDEKTSTQEAVFNFIALYYYKIESQHKNALDHHANIFDSQDKRDYKRIVDTRPIIIKDKYGEGNVSTQRYVKQEDNHLIELWGDLYQGSNADETIERLLAFDTLAKDEELPEFSMTEYKRRNHGLKEIDNLYLVKNKGEKFILAKKDEFMLFLSQKELSDHEEFFDPSNKNILSIIKNVFSDNKLLEAKIKAEDGEYGSSKLMLKPADMPSGFTVNNISRSESYVINHSRLNDIFGGILGGTTKQPDGLRCSEDYANKPGDIGYRAYHFKLDGLIELKMMTRMMWAHQLVGPSNHDAYEILDEKKGKSVAATNKKISETKTGVEDERIKRELIEHDKYMDATFKRLYKKRIDNICSDFNKGNFSENPEREFHYTNELIKTYHNEFGTESVKASDDSLIKPLSSELSNTIRRALRNVPISYMKSNMNEEQFKDNSMLETLKLIEIVEKNDFFLIPGTSEYNPGKKKTINSYNENMKNLAGKIIFDAYNKYISEGENEKDEENKINQMRRVIYALEDYAEFYTNHFSKYNTSEKKADEIKKVYELFTENVKKELKKKKGFEASNTYSPEQTEEFLTELKTEVKKKGAEYLPATKLHESIEKEIFYQGLSNLAETIETKIKTKKGLPILNAIVNLYVLDGLLNDDRIKNELEKTHLNELTSRLSILKSEHFVKVSTGDKTFFTKKYKANNEEIIMDLGTLVSNHLSVPGHLHKLLAPTRNAIGALPQTHHEAIKTVAGQLYNAYNAKPIDIANIH